MVRAKYEYNIDHIKGKDVIIISDHGGSLSLTNDIENVVEEIGRLNKINPDDYIIVYKDSTGRWDGWDNTSQDFVILDADDSIDAIERYLYRL